MPDDHGPSVFSAPAAEALGAGDPPRIPAEEFHDRVRRAGELVKEAGLDALLVTSNEADFADVRYFCDYWTLFEKAGVLIPAEGEPALLIGPESEAYARDTSHIERIHKLVAYRESADPAYPGVAVSRFEDVFADCGIPAPRRIGLGGYLVTPAPVLDALGEAFPGARLTPADDLMVRLRSVKSDNELACLRRAFEVSELAVDAVLEEVRAGMTQRQVVGIAQRVMYQQGAEYEGHPTYVLSGRSTRHAISRPTSKAIAPGDLVQLNIGARVSGYSSSVGLPICVGKMTPAMRDLVSFGLDAHQQTMDRLRPGVVAADVARWYQDMFEQRGYGDHFLYGPCHGLGMMEVEQPWMEQTSDYQLQQNMTFQVDTFVQGQSFGLRWENGGVVGAQGFEPLSGRHRRLIELG